MDSIAKSVEVEKTHYQRAPAVRRDVVSKIRIEQLLFRVHSKNLHFNARRVVLSRADGMDCVHLRFQLNWKFHHSGGAHQVRRTRGQTRFAKLVLHMTETHLLFVPRNGIHPSRQRKAVHRPDLVNGREIQDTLAISLQIGKGLAPGAKAENTDEAEPPGRGHGGEIHRTILIH